MLNQPTVLSGQGDYIEAVSAYEAGSDWDSVVRLYLEKLQAPQKAAALVRKGCTRDGALRLAHYCMSAKDYQVCIAPDCMPLHELLHAVM